MRTILDKIYHKHFDLITKGIGVWCIAFSFYSLSSITFDLSNYFPSLIRDSIIISVFGIFLYGGIAFIRHQSPHSWVIVTLSPLYLFFYKLQSLPFYFKLLDDEQDGIFSMANMMDISPIHEIKTTFLEMALLLILISILYNHLFIKRYQVSTKLAFLTIGLGFLLSGLHHFL